MKKRKTQDDNQIRTNETKYGQIKNNKREYQNNIYKTNEKETEKKENTS